MQHNHHYQLCSIIIIIDPGITNLIGSSLGLLTLSNTFAEERANNNQDFESRPLNGMVIENNEVVTASYHMIDP